MTRADLVSSLTQALAEAVGSDPSVKTAIVAFAAIGECVTGMTIQIDIETAQLAPPVSASADADFLRTLHIAPDISVSERTCE